MTILFISDLHLDAARPGITESFLSFLEQEASKAERLYILGDFFEVWVGDDDPDPHHARVIAGLRELTDSGVPVCFMHGNRDFLIGEGFAERTGCQLLADPATVELNGIPTLLMHGDTLCTDDVEYQQFRRVVRDPEQQRAFLAKPLAERRAFATQARGESKARTRNKPEIIMDVNQQTVEQAMREHNVTQMIHGHTHRPAIHRFTLDNHDMTRVVLGDWYEQKSILRFEDGEMLLDDSRVTA